MKIDNTGTLPVVVFHMPAGGEQRGQVLPPGASIELDLQPGDSVQTRVATELLDQPETPAEA